jgi:flagellar hook-associated protein 2
MAVLNIGGLATGLDTNKIVDQLVALERQRAVGLLETQKQGAQAHETALQGFNTKVLAFLTAIDKLRDASVVLARQASSSDTTLVTASAANGAAAGSTTITVSALARSAIATSATGTSSVDDTIASGSGSFAFRVGSGVVQTVALDTSTTLQGLANAINDLDAGATATIINVGTSAAPDYRLRLASDATGTSNDLTIVTDDTTIGVAVTQTAGNASFTISGFVDPLARESNTFDDVIPGVTLNLAGTGGPVTITVGTDVAATTSLLQGAVDAYNDLVGYAAGESAVTQDSQTREIQAGPLAFDQTVRSILTSLRGLVSGSVDGLSSSYTLLTQLGVQTQKDGTLTFDTATFQAALAQDETAVAALLGGSGSTDGVADRLHDFLGNITGAGGLIEIGTTTVTNQISSLDDRIQEGQRNLDQFEANLRATFVSLEVLVSSLQSQGSLLQSFFGGTKG